MWCFFVLIGNNSIYHAPWKSLIWPRLKLSLFQLSFYKPIKIGSHVMVRWYINDSKYISQLNYTHRQSSCERHFTTVSTRKKLHTSSSCWLPYKSSYLFHNVWYASIVISVTLSKRSDCMISNSLAYWQFDCILQKQ